MEGHSFTHFRGLRGAPSPDPGVLLMGTVGGPGTPSMITFWKHCKDYLLKRGCIAAGLSVGSKLLRALVWKLQQTRKPNRLSLENASACSHV